MHPLIPYAMGFVAMICYASLPVIAKKMHLDTPPFAFIAITMILLTLFAGLASFLYEKDFQISTIPTTSWALLIGFSFINFVGFSLFLNAVKFMHVTEYQMILMLMPIVSAAFAYLMLQEPFKIQYIIGFAFCSVGLFIALKN